MSFSAGAQFNEVLNVVTTSSYHTELQGTVPYYLGIRTGVFLSQGTALLVLAGGARLEIRYLVLQQ